MHQPPLHQQCDVIYREIRRATVWSYKFHRRIDGCVPPAEGMRPYEKLTIPTDLAIVDITLLVAGSTVGTLRAIEMLSFSLFVTLEPIVE